MKKKCFDWEQVFAFIWKNADEDGLWAGDSKTLAAKFHVTEDDAHSALGDLCNRNLIQRVGERDFMITRWRERDDPGDVELRWWEFTATLRHR